METFVVWAALIWGLPSSPGQPIKIGNFGTERDCLTYAKREVSVDPSRQISCVRSVISKRTRDEERARNRGMTRNFEEGLRRIREQKREPSPPPQGGVEPLDIELD